MKKIRLIRSIVVGSLLGLVLVFCVDYHGGKPRPIDSIVRIHNGFITGSGSIVSCELQTDGFYDAKIYTAAHLFYSKRDNPLIEVFYRQGGSSLHKSSVTHLDGYIDFAVVLIEDLTEKLPCLRVADAGSLYQDNESEDRIQVLGCSLGNPPFIKEGKINWMQNELGAVLESFICYSAPSIFGDSGGALVNADGELIGIVSALSLVQVGGYPSPFEHLSYAVPISLVHKSLEGSE